MSDIITQIAKQQFEAFTSIATRFVDVAACYEHDISSYWDNGDFVINHNGVKKVFKSGCHIDNCQLQVEINKIKDLPLEGVA